MQDFKDCEINISTLSTKKLKRILNNFEIEIPENVTEDQWLESATPREKIFSRCISFLNNKKRIVGVEDINNEMKIGNDFMGEKNTSIYALLIVGAFIIYYLVKVLLSFFNTTANQGLLIGIAVIISLVLVFCIFIIIKAFTTTKKSMCLNISYPTNDSFKINDLVFNYKNNDIRITLNEVKKPIHYIMTISENNIPHHFEISLDKEQQMFDFINNFYFE